MDYEAFITHFQTSLHSEMAQVEEHLFLGHYGNAENKDKLDQNQISHIVNATFDLDCKFPNDYIYKVVPVMDLPSQNISQYFSEAVKFIKNAIEGGGNVLVHCGAGISRSTSIVMAYLISERGLNYFDALAKVRSVRPIATPNEGFMKQLQDFEESLKNQVNIFTNDVLVIESGSENNMHNLLKKGNLYFIEDVNSTIVIISRIVVIIISSAQNL